MDQESYGHTLGHTARPEALHRPAITQEASCAHEMSAVLAPMRLTPQDHDEGGSPSTQPSPRRSNRQIPIAAACVLIARTARVHDPIS